MDGETLLRRDAAAAALTAHGYPVASSTLMTMASRGGGPPYRKFGTRPVYKWAELLAWAQSRLSPVMGSSSEADRANAAG
jgi:hypothetical protein